MDVRPFPVKGYSVEELDGELLLFNIRSDNILHTNQTGALVWKLCNGERTTASIVKLLQDAYPEAAVSIQADVPQILDAFAQAGAIQWK